MSAVVVLHIVCASLSVILGAAVLLLKKGNALHRQLGRAWAVAMIATSLSSFSIHLLNPGHFSWVHALSVLTLVSVTRAVLAIRQGNVRGHRIAMRGSFFGLVTAGVAAIATPHRILNLILAGWM